MKVSLFSGQMFLCFMSLQVRSVHTCFITVYNGRDLKSSSVTSVTLLMDLFFTSYPANNTFNKTFLFLQGSQCWLLLAGVWLNTCIRTKGTNMNYISVHHYHQEDDCVYSSEVMKNEWICCVVRCWETRDHGWIWWILRVPVIIFITVSRPTVYSHMSCSRWSLSVYLIWNDSLLSCIAPHTCLLESKSAMKSIEIPSPSFTRCGDRSASALLWLRREGTCES